MIRVDRIVLSIIAALLCLYLACAGIVAWWVGLIAIAICLFAAWLEWAEKDMW